MALMDQQSDIRQQMNMHRMVTTDPGKMSSDGERRVETLDLFLISWVYLITSN